MPRGPKGERRLADVAAGISDTLWSVKDMAEMIDVTLPKPGPRGRYRKRVG
jgi:hypothetical protein